ncbi:MAG TPA: serine/threonine-protein kinase [Gemmataceae bacterium]|nr:serine/threonine-protein kinase [Gemmataceae bacterium]
MTEESTFEDAPAQSDPQETATGSLPNAPAPPGATGDYASGPVDASRSTAESPGTVVASSAAAGAVVAGRYTLVEKIGEGGMGEVWAAAQTKPVKRQVALKLIKAGMDTQAVLQRFEQERQALALMDHPNIARVFDGGLTADRRPFFVMELVKGLPLTQFCDEAKFGVRDRLALFVQVCQAVQHAHQKGVVHRDLKPGNILAARIDGKPAPKVIDFGVAKAVGGKLLEESLTTQFGTVLGTLEYMAPEQAGFVGDDIDTRADIYSLGVILYELLTGLLPLENLRSRQAPLSEVLRIIQQQEPSKPSARLSAQPTAPALAALRQTEPKKLTALLRRELDWVVMKCLEKQRERRYETADGLARDLQRYLADEPVEARPPSVGYRLRKFVARHKGAAAIAAVALLALTACVAVSTTAAVLIWREQKHTEAARQTAAENADAAIEVVRDLNGYVEAYETGSGNAAADNAQRQQRLDSVLASYERLLALHPEDPVLRGHVARMNRINANLCRFLNRTAEAEKSYHEAIRLYGQLVADYPQDPFYRDDNALTLRDYGEYLQRIGRYQEGARIMDDSIRLIEELAAAHPDEPKYQRSLALSLVGRSDQEYQVGRLAESEQAARKAAELYAKLADTPGVRPEPVDPLLRAMAESNLAVTLREEVRLDEALAAHDRAVDHIAGLTKVTNSRDAWSFYHRARTERAWTLSRVPGRSEEAITELESAIQGWDKLIKQMGEIPTDLERKGVAGFYCGRIKMQLGRREEAVKDLSAAAAIQEGLVGKQPEILVYRYDLGRTYTALGQLAADPQEAAGWYRKAHEMLDAAVQRYPENAQYRKAMQELDALAPPKL